MYIYGAPCKARNFNIIYIEWPQKMYTLFTLYFRCQSVYIFFWATLYMDLGLATLKAVSFYLLHNVSMLNQYRKFSCVTVVCKHFASYQGYPKYKCDLIR
jgi:hypothetical protein